MDIKDNFIYQHNVELKSIQEIADAHGVHRNHIRKAILDGGGTILYNAVRRQKQIERFLTKELLHQKYIVEKKSTVDISRETGVSRQHIGRKLKDFGIEARTQDFYSPRMGDHPGWKGIGSLPKSLYTRTRNNARIRKIEFDVTIEYLWDLYISQGGRCCLSGWGISFQPTLRCSASLDRIDSSKGYVAGNVWWVHRDANLAKQSLSCDEFLKLCCAVVAHSRK